MDSQNEIIISLRDKLKKLISICDQYKFEKQQIQEENNRLKAEISDKQKALAELEERHGMLKTAKSLAQTGGDAHEVKIKINRIVREIDSCIAQMNR